MAEVKWIKIVTDIFDDEKMLLIESLPSADSIIVIWFKLLCFAGKSNNSGVFLMNDKVPYTDEMLSAVFRRDLSVIKLALKTFEDFGMIEIVNNTITIPNWDKHQTLDAYEKKKERDRIYQKQRRDKQKMLTIGNNLIESSDTSSELVSTSQKIVPLDIEEDIDKEYIYISLSFIDDSIDKVKLTQEQYDKLINKFSKDLVHKTIISLDTYIANGTKKYKDHYRTLNNWCTKNNKEAPKVFKSTGDDFNY